MTGITEARTFGATVNRYDTTDPVLGGVSGESNDPIIALANRTRYLYDFKNGFESIASVTGSVTIDDTFLRKLIYINASANITLSLAAISNFVTGQILRFKCKNSLGKCAAIVPAGAELIKDGSLTRNIWLYDGEEITLIVRSGTEWEILDCKGNFDMVGNDGMSRIQPRNTLVADGTTGLLRADYARLWEVISAYAVSDALWLTDAVTYRGYFSLGNGSTTFRVPDMRSMMWRGLDAGRGIDITRIGGGAGAYAPDIIKAHKHVYKKPQLVNGGGPPLIIDNGNDYGISDGVDTDTTTVGGAENTTKNIGFTPVIYF